MIFLIPIVKKKWFDLLENPESLQAIYNSDIPDLNDVEIIEMKIVFGEDIQCLVKFTLRKLPTVLPEKWKERKVSIVQIELLLVNIKMKQFTTDKFNFVGNLKLSNNGAMKTVYFESNQQLFFTIDTNWIYVQSISGQSRNLDSI